MACMNLLELILAMVRIRWLHQMKDGPCVTGWSWPLLIEGVQATKQVLKGSRRPGLRCWWCYCDLGGRN